MEIKITSGWLKATDDNVNGKVFTINKDVEEAENKFKPEEPRLVVQLLDDKGDEIMCSLNKTSRKNLVKAYGNQSTEWIGKKVIAYVMLVNVGGEAKKTVILDRA